MKSICIYASSSNEIAKVYFEKARELAMLIAQRGWHVIFGGGMDGLMGTVASCTVGNKGHITGVIPELLNVKNVVFEHCDELIVTKTLRERKSIMEERADAFIALPGGFGTMEELLEIITLKQLRYHTKPIVVMNINGYYDGLHEVFERTFEEKFARESSRELFFFAGNAQEAVEYIEKYK